MPGKSINRYKIDYDFIKRLQKGLGGKPDEQIQRVLKAFPKLEKRNNKVFLGNQELLPVEDLHAVLNDELISGLCPMSCEAAYNFLKEKYVGSLTKRNVREFIMSLESWQLNRKRQPNPDNIKASYKHERDGITRFLLGKRSGGDWNHVSADLMYIPKQWSKFSYFFCIVHVRSGFCFFEPLTDRRAQDLVSPFRKVLAKIEERFGPVKLMTTDDGSEFKKEFTQFLKSRGIRHLHEHKSYVCERKIGQFGKTMGKLLGLGVLFEEALVLSITKLNNTLSKVTGHTPTNVKKNTKLKPFRKLRKGQRRHRKLQEYEEGDSVRFAKKNQEDTNIFYKSYGSTSRRPKHENWSKEVVKIITKKIVFGMPLYKLPRKTKWLKGWELQLVPALRTLSVPRTKIKLPTDLRKKIASVQKQTPIVRMDKDLRSLVSDLGTYWKPERARRQRKKINYKE